MDKIQKASREDGSPLQITTLLKNLPSGVVPQSFGGGVGAPTDDASVATTVAWYRAQLQVRAATIAAMEAGPDAAGAATSSSGGGGGGGAGDDLTEEQE